MSSASTNWMYSPCASSIPLFRAMLTPWLSCLNKRTLRFELSTFKTLPAASSLQKDVSEPSSMTIISRSSAANGSWKILFKQSSSMLED